MSRSTRLFAPAAWFLPAVLSAFGLLVGSAEPNRPVREELDVPYGEVEGAKLLLDIRRPAEAAPQPNPAIVLIHGGGWAGGSRKQFRELAEALVQGGYFTASIDYRLVTTNGNRWPAQIEDARRAVRWLRSRAATYHLNPAKMGALGDSAGGHLVAFLGTTDARDDSDPALARYPSKVQCVVDLYGPADLTSDFSAHGPAGLWVQSLITNLVGRPPAALTAYQAASPLFSVTPGAAPFLIFHGSKDGLVPLDQSVRLDSALRAAGVDSKLIVFEGEDHGFKQPANRATFLEETKAFFDRHLK